MSDSRPIYLLHHLPKTGGVSLRTWLVHHLGFHQRMIHYGVAGELICMQQRLPFLEQLPTEHLNGIDIVMGHYVTESTADFFPGREVRRLIVLREPTKRLISQYNHAMHFWCSGMGRPQISFYEWFENHAVERYDYKDDLRKNGLSPEIAFQSQCSLGSNYIARFISQNFDSADWPNLNPTEAAAQINALLETFWMVGFTEQLGEFATKLGNDLNIPADIPHENIGAKRGTYLKPDTELLEFIREYNQTDYLIYNYWKARSESATLN